MEAALMKATEAQRAQHAKAAQTRMQALEAKYRQAFANIEQRMQSEMAAIKKRLRLA